MENIQIYRDLLLLVIMLCAVPLFFISLKLFMMEIEEILEPEQMEEDGEV